MIGQVLILVAGNWREQIDIIQTSQGAWCTQPFSYNTSEATGVNLWTQGLCLINRRSNLMALQEVKYSLDLPSD